MRQNQETMKNRVYKFIQKNPTLSKSQIAHHFMLEGVPKSTIYDYIRNYENNEPVERKKGSGRVAKIKNKQTIKKLNTMFNNRSGCSQRRAAKAIGCSPRYIGLMLKDIGIKRRKKEKIPCRTLQQQQSARPKCRKMCEAFRGHDFVMDDESYFTLTNSSLAGNDIFYTKDIHSVPENVRYKKMAKFEKKVLVWLAISPKGVSEAHFQQSGLAINQHLYRDECLEKRLYKFIKTHHSEDNYVFWPDLASAHYAKTVVAWYNENNINFVPKMINPANLPEVRPIEDFWAYLKRMVYADNYQAKTVAELTSRIKKCLKMIDLNFVQRLMAGTWTRLDIVRRNGVEA